MMNRRKNLTVDGIHYYLVGNCYVPTAPGFVPDRRTDDYGMLHLKYLQMAHPDDAAELLMSGRGRQYLLRIDQMVKQFIKEREEMAPIPQLSDPAFEEKYIRYYIMSCNATCKAETKFVLSGLHRDILADIKEPDGGPIDKGAKVISNDEERIPEVSFERWLDMHPFQKAAVKSALRVRHEYKKSRPPRGSFEQWLNSHPYEKSIYDRAELIRCEYKKDCAMRRREKACAMRRKEAH